MKRKIGLGSLSIVLLVIFIITSISIKGYCIGDSILESLGFQAWSKSGRQGIHYTVLYSLIFLILSIFIGRKYEEDFLAELGMKISLVLLILISLILFIGLV
ncbi:MAG: hypothetical protein ACTHWZ_02375 [Peptoniphilaceae bacterium]